MLRRRAHSQAVIAAAYLVAAGLGACGGDPPALTVGELEFSENELLGLSPDRRLRLAEIAALGLAVTRGELVHRSEALRAREARRALIDVLRTEHLLEAAEVDDEVLAAHYEMNPEYELVVRHLVVLAERGLPRSVREEARQRAAAALTRIQEAEPFQDVAGAVSEEPGAAERGGLLTPGREGTWVEEFWSAASALEPGQVSEVVETQFGFHVLRLDERRVVPFDEARPRTAAHVAEMLPAGPFLELRDAVAEGVSIDAAALAEWPAVDSTRALATWTDGSLIASDFATHLATEPAATERAALTGGEGLEDAVQAAALERALAEAARSRGFAFDEAAIDERLDDWRVQAEGWAAVLGLVGARGNESLAARTLEALRSTGQNASVARDELARLRGPLLRTLYPIETAADARP